MKPGAFVLTLALVLVTPSIAAAKQCVDQYYMCLNDSWNTSGIFRYIADVKCLLQYLGCVRDSIT